MLLHVYAHKRINRSREMITGFNQKKLITSAINQLCFGSVGVVLKQTIFSTYFIPPNNN